MPTAAGEIKMVLNWRVGYCCDVTGHRQEEGLGDGRGIECMLTVVRQNEIVGELHSLMSAYQWHVIDEYWLTSCAMLKYVLIRASP